MSAIDKNSEPSDQSELRPLGVLPPGYLVAEFRIERVLGKGGFGIVYLALDTRLERLVAIKEFMPQSLAQRLADYSIVPLSDRHRETFELGLRSFIREARSLAKFKHPALVEVYRFWEELGTAYMVMPFYEGQTLQQRLEGMTALPPERWLRELMARVLEGLDVVHQQGWLHRDIAPDNILLLPGDRPMLLDFGSAKQDIGDATQALAVILKPGYAPFEQYSDSASLKQGPWTDLYAVGAMLYFAISGKVPVASVERVKNDTMVSAHMLGQRRYSAAFLRFIDHCLAVWPEQRPRNITAALELLRGLDAEEKVVSKRKNFGDRHQDAGTPKLAKNDTRGFSLLSRWQGPSSWAGGITVLLLTLGGLVLWEPWSTPAVHMADKGSAIPVHPAHSGSPPSDDLSSTPAVVMPDSLSPPLSAPQIPEVLHAELPAQFASPATPEKALDNLLAERDPNIHVVVTPASEKQTERFRFTVKASEPGFLYVFAIGQRRDRLELLWPTDDESLLMIEHGQTWRIDAALPLAAGSPRKRYIGVMVSRAARHLASAGWKQQAGALSMSLSDAPKTRATPWFGRPMCAPVPGACSAEFGAARIELTYSQAPSKTARTSSTSRLQLATAKKAECESLAHLLSLDGNALAQRRFAQLGCRRQ
jgi:serine/threonine protein kinase